MMKQSFFLTISLFLLCAVAFSQDLRINFGLNQYSISESSEMILKNKLMRFQYCDSILIIGYADTIGTVSYNMELSKKRTESIKNWLVMNSVNPRVIQICWKGESDVIDSRPDSSDRHADIFVFSKHKEKSEKDEQFFSIDNSRDTTVYGRKGTIVRIPAGSILSHGGKSRNLSEIILKEYYSISDILLNHLSTRTETEILETRGMINLQIVQNGETCTINPEIPIVLGFRNTNPKDDGMSLFYGKENPDKEIIWELAENQVQTDKAYAYVIVEEMPTFSSALYKDFNSYAEANIKYPPEATDKGICGIVYVGFTVDASGVVRNPSILRGVHPSLDAEALRVISESPKWNPGRQNGKKVSVLYNFPIYFKLSSDCDCNNNGEGISYNDSTFKTSDVNKLSRYIFSTLKLGWINCDRFVYQNIPLTTYNLSVNVKGDISTFMIFEKSNSVLTGSLRSGKYVFNQVPKGERVTIGGILKLGNKTFISTKKTTISNIVEKLDNFEEISLMDLNARLDSLKKDF